MANNKKDRSNCVSIPHDFSAIIYSFLLFSDVVSVSCFGVRVSVMFQFMFVHYTFSSVCVAEWPPFEK